MKTKRMILIMCAALPLAGCASHQGATEEQPSALTGGAQSNPQPAGSPTFRPGMNPNDPRDPHFTTRPGAQPLTPTEVP
jgi:hypothetical protein